MKVFPSRLTVAGLLIGGILGSTCFPSTSLAQKVQLRTLSSAPEMVSGDDVLVEAKLPSADAAMRSKIYLNDVDVTSAFHSAGAPGILRGLVTGLHPHHNLIAIKVAGNSAELHIINHPSTGPVFSGPHQKPFICQTEDNKLGPALDSDCSAKTVITYLYHSTAPPDPKASPISPPNAPPAGFKPLDPSAPLPSDIAKTTTTLGQTVNYIVRVEKGTINRAAYEIAFLHEPGQPLPSPWAPTPGWNGRLVYDFGGDCKAGYRQGIVATAINDMKLSQGYATATSSLNIFGNNCDDVISAETLMMVKEHFIKTFGVPVHTIGEGGSGGSMQQHLIVQNYPGLLDGIMPSASFPDATSLAQPVSDCSLLDRAFIDTKGPWTPEQKKAVSGTYSWASCERWIAAGYAFDPTKKIQPNGHVFVRATPCDPTVPANLVYDPIKNPQGVRCSVYDNEVNVYDRDPSTGFTRRPWDNIGVQYGLQAFNAGTLSAEQFLDLNEKVGGYDNDGGLVPTRTAANPEALRIAYASGRVDSGSGGLGDVPIIDVRPYLDAVPDIHDSVRSFAMRERLKTAQGTVGNHVIITLPAPSGPMPMAFFKLFDPKSVQQVQTKEALRQMDVWLDRIAADHSNANLKSKVARNKPADLVDGCFTETGEKIAEPRVYGAPGRCNQLYPSYADPRLASGAPLAGDVLKCQLKPIANMDYAHPLTAANLARLRTIFPQGVCDYTKPGVGQRPISKTWQSY